MVNPRAWFPGRRSPARIKGRREGDAVRGERSAAMHRRLLLVLVAASWGASPASAREGPASTVRVAGIVLKWVRGDKEANQRRIEPMIREAARNGAQVIVTTECFL